MFLALYFATEEERPEVAANDNEPGLAAGWYAEALARLADSNRQWTTAHAAALMGEPAV